MPPFLMVIDLHQLGIVHIAREDHNVTPVSAYREQTVVIVLGPKGAFENRNIGGLAESDPRGIRQRMPGT